jgi:hypothetical protein
MAMTIRKGVTVLSCGHGDADNRRMLAGRADGKPALAFICEPCIASGCTGLKGQQLTEDMVIVDASEADVDWGWTFDGLN